MARVAVVTGGTRGIGAAVSKALKAAGCQVAATYHSNDEAAAKFKAETGVHVYKWNVANYDACVAGLAKVAEDLGPVEILVNNAGITKDGMFHKMTPDQWYGVINTNLNSLFNMCRPVIEGMRERKFGRMISISSINGQKGQMGQVNYSAAKAGDIGFTKALAQESASKGITVNAICPGYIATDMVLAINPEGRGEKSSCRRSRSAVSASRRISRAASSSSPPTTPASSPARRCRPTAGSIWLRVEPRSAQTAMTALGRIPAVQGSRCDGKNAQIARDYGGLR